MNPKNKTENIEDLSNRSVIDESATVDDFIKELEAKERDLHITADTTFIEIAEDIDVDEFPEYLSVEFSTAGEEIASPAVPPLSKHALNTESQFENEISKLKSRITVMETERSEMFENSKRRAKDFEAFKARTARERSETFQNQLSNLAVKMLPALDNLDRALKFASEMPEDKRNKLLQFFDGISLVNQQVTEVLADMGILPIETVGNTFDPHFHEAVAVEESGDFPPNTVSEELMRGYRIGDKVIRHSMVKVTKPLPLKVSSKAPLDGENVDVDFSNANCPDDQIDAPGHASRETAVENLQDE